MLIVDSNEKWTQPGSRDKHLRNYFDRHGIMWRRERLNVGDYMLDGGKISVDRKYGLEELSKNLTNQDDNIRFMAEIRRAYEAGIKLVFLVEQHGINIEKNRIVQGEPIKSFGSYEVKCKFGFGIDGTLNLLVIEK